MFNVRVYGILLFDHKILLSDETHLGLSFTKFPGGGLKFGEGTIDGLKREFVEEFDWEIKVKEHFYTTDFFVPSVFDDKEQVLSIYYLIEKENASQPGFQSLLSKEKNITLKWKLFSEFTAADVTFPIDKKVAELLLK